MNAEIQGVQQSIENLQINLIGTANNLQENQMGLQEQIINLDNQKMDKNIDVGFKIEVGQVYLNLQWEEAQHFITITEIVEEKFDCIRFKFDETYVYLNESVLLKGVGIYDKKTNDISLNVREITEGSLCAISTGHILDSKTFKTQKHLIRLVEKDNTPTSYINYWIKV